MCENDLIWMQSAESARTSGTDEAIDALEQHNHHDGFTVSDPASSVTEPHEGKGVCLLAHGRNDLVQTSRNRVGRFVSFEQAGHLMGARRPTLRVVCYTTLEIRLADCSEHLRSSACNAVCYGYATSIALHGDRLHSSELLQCLCWCH